MSSEAAHNGAASAGAAAPSVGHREPAQAMMGYSRESLLADPAGYFEELMKTEVDEHTIGLLSNMFAQELMLGNLSEDEYNEMRYLARNLVDFVEAEHPSSKSTFTGKRRAVLSGDYSNQLKPLSGIQHAWIEMAIFNFVSILSRSKEGFQQEMNSKSIHESYGNVGGGGRSGGWRSLIPWGR